MSGDPVSALDRIENENRALRAQLERYEGLIPREHEMSVDCWCGPRIEHVEAGVNG